MITIANTGKVVGRRTFFSLPFSPTNSLQTYNVTKIIHTKNSHIYEVVSNVDKYKEFIPFVEDSYVNQRDEKNIPTEGGIDVGWQQFNEKLVCKLTCTPGKQVIAQSLPTSIFDKLYTEWNFIPMNENMTKVNLNLQFNFKNPLYNSMSSMFSEQLTSIMIKAFEDRVHSLYKK